MELLQELRVAIPGIQFLFAFLLVVPFQQGWGTVSEFEKTVYYITLLATAASSVLLMAPTARHRLRFRELDKEWIVESSNRLTIVGLFFLGLAIVGVILLISNVVYGTTEAALATTGVLLGVAWFWWLAPVVRSIRHD
jgi:hypothetical protein